MADPRTFGVLKVGTHLRGLLGWYSCARLSNLSLPALQGLLTFGGLRGFTGGQLHFNSQPAPYLQANLTGFLLSGW